MEKYSVTHHKFLRCDYMSIHHRTTCHEWFYHDWCVVIHLPFWSHDLSSWIRGPRIARATLSVSLNQTRAALSGLERPFREALRLRAGSNGHFWIRPPKNYTIRVFMCWACICLVVSTSQMLNMRFIFPISQSAIEVVDDALGNLGWVG